MSISMPRQLKGFDSAGEVFISDDRILRGIYPGKGDIYRRVLGECLTHDLFSLGIVKTHLLAENPYPELGYDMVLEHERIPFISYPHEWPSSMLKDAALFHIDLFLKIADYGLTIKDWHPYNILFKGTNPIFIDFLSIIPREYLLEEEYLINSLASPRIFRRLWDINSKLIYWMYQCMFLPYFLLPLYMMHKERYVETRKRMLQTTLNASSDVINEDEALGTSSIDRIAFKLRELYKQLSLLGKDADETKFLKVLRKEVSGLKVSPKSSNYIEYYNLKRENSDFKPSPLWTDKQRTVYEAIAGLKPDSVMDIGCNTGWFSVLAARQGCSVLAFDIDEACVDALYHKAKKEGLPILPLVINLANPTEDILPIKYNGEADCSHLKQDAPLLLSIEKRFKCDLVIALAIIHHLLLGQNLEFEKVMELMNSLSRKHLLLEFVPIDDELIVSEPDFFPAWKSNPGGFTWYTLENLIDELGKYFSRIKVCASHPKSRKILICSK